MSEKWLSPVAKTGSYTDLKDKPTSLKNPTALTVQLNGSTNKIYDGTVAQTVNITPSAIDAATSNHTHNYAGSSSAGGAANSAVKVGNFTATGTPNTVEKTDLIAMINEVFQSASNGKSAIANAITAKGVSASSSDTYTQLSDKIKSIKVGISTADATAAAGQILSGQTAYVNGSKVTGNMPNLTGIRTATGWAKWGNEDLAVYPERGYQKGGSGDGEIKVPVDAIRSLYGITANKIAAGQSIAGINGNVQPKHYAHGTISLQYHTKLRTELGFTPNLIVLKRNRSSYYEIHNSALPILPITNDYTFQTSIPTASLGGTFIREYIYLHKNTSTTDIVVYPDGTGFSVNGSDTTTGEYWALQV